MIMEGKRFEFEINYNVWTVLTIGHDASWEQSFVQILCFQFVVNHNI